jgi:radical SAM superfamily enzyme YgiQ (UPF0313 family)
VTLTIGPDTLNQACLDTVLVQPRNPFPHWSIIPLGCLAIGLHLDALGLNVAVWDCNNDPRATDEALAALLRDRPVRSVGISVLSTHLTEARRLARLVREVSPDTRIIVGGQHVCEQALATFPEADHLVTGEGELAMEQLLGNPGDGTLPRWIQGTPYTELDRVCMIPAAVFRRYREFNTLARLGIMVSRGCPFDCAYCHFDGRSRKVRACTPARVGELVETAHRETGIGDIFFLDDIFTLHRDWLMEVLAELHRRQLTGLAYTCFSHVAIRSREIYRALGQAGFTQVQFGIESGDPATRRRMHKHFTDDEARAAVQMVKDCGMEPNCLFILGYAGETEATMRRTLEFAESLETTLWFSLAQPLPGTVFLEEAMREGMLLEHDYARYGNQRIVYLPAGVTLEQMQRIHAEADALRIRQGLKYSRERGAGPSSHDRVQPQPA